MSSRYTGSRERSPPRHPDRRPSATYVPGASSYRGTGEPQASSLDRPPPRGPKADFRGSGYQFSSASRGRGAFTPRAGDTWDRERERDRDPRNQPPAYRREDDRGDWPRRERDFPPSDRGVGFQRGYVGRDRSASPDRPRRNSKENIVPPFNRPAESGSSYYGPAIRGSSARGRGRGDWDRSRGRSSFVSEREREFYPRSRSREEWRERDYDRGRPSGPDAERNDRFDRRDYDRSDDREVRGREHDVWQRDRSPGRNSTGRPTSPGAVSTVSQHGERHRSDYDASRKASLAGPLSARSEGRREGDSDYFSTRTEMPRRDAPLSQPFPTPSVPQSASLGLDYGPPPPAPVTTPLQEKPAQPKPPVAKTDPPIAPVVLQPPSGPKADRVGPPPNAPSTPRAASQQFEQWSKSESANRPLRPIPALNTVPPASESNWKTGESPAENRTPSSAIADRPLPANVPSGPRAVTGFRGRLLSNEQAAPNAPPTAPRQPKANTIEIRTVPNAPTGPRSSTFPAPGGSHNAPPTGPQAGSNRQWVAPDYRPSKPSIMSGIRERSSLSGPSSRPGGVTYQSQQARPKITQPLSSDSTSPSLLTKPIGLLAETPSGAQTPMDEDMVDSPADVEMSLPASDEEDAEDDDGLDEDYFAASEETHSREMKQLESKKPPPPFLDSATSSLIIRIQLLGMIANDIVPEAYEEIKVNAESAMELDSTPTNAPLSPEFTPDGSSLPTLEHPKPRGRPLSQPLVNTIPTPPIDELPYLNALNDAMEECHVFSENEQASDQHATTMLLCQTFANDAWEHIEQLEVLHDRYKSMYPQWRREVEQAEVRLREVHRPSPAPASPAPSATPSLPPGPERSGIERTRGARNTTDLDMQQAILMSQQSAKEEEERREREAASNALPNYETEAVVPPMLKPSELDASYFEDTNNMVDHMVALDVYGFIPPEDDFTEEEQGAFIAAYCQTPKKWGKIAEAIPDRSYQDCIMHYYLTKSEANYKERWRRSQPKRGRRRANNVKPRANNLMSDLALNEEGEGTPVAVTDSGRPRRAAAPTFGDIPDTDASIAAPQAKKLKEGIKDGDPAQPKPRGRKGTGAGKGRKPKEKIMADTTGQPLLPAGTFEASAQKPDRSSFGKEKIVKTSMKAENVNPKLEPYNASNLTTQLALGINNRGTDDVSHNNMVHAPPTVTSYWSVPEQQKFPYLVQHFGSDYAAIANFLKTKSSIMIKNYYTREIANGKDQLKEYARIADEKRARGESMGPPPTPVQPPKRRYEATPSMAAIPRPVTSTVDHHMTETEAVASVTKPIIEEFPSNSIQRIAGEVVAKPRPPRETLRQSPVSSHVHPKVEEPVRSDRPSLLQKPLQGPPRGYFQDEPLAYTSTHQKLQAPIQESSPRQRPVQMVDHRPADARTQQPAQAVELIRGTDFGRGLLPHSREQVLQPQQSSIMPHVQPAADRPLHQHQRIVSHGRHPSLSTNHTSQNTHEQAAADLASLRNIDTSRGMPYNVLAARSPIPVPVQAATLPSAESQSNVRPIPPPVEPPKQAPVKRSNVFSILNNDDPEPPVKRQSTESSRRNTVNTPPPQSIAAQPNLSHSRHPEDGIRSTHPSYNNNISRMDPIRSDYRQEYASSPAPVYPNEALLDKFDPRQRNQIVEQRSAQQSPVSSTYSVVPPNSQPSAAASVQSRFDPARNLEPSMHRRSLLGLDRHAPSPPPQQQQQASQLHRSSSTSSQHGRGLSANYQTPNVTNPPSYPHSTSSTPLPIIAHRSQNSIDVPRRTTIQQHLRDRDREQEIHKYEHAMSGRGREIDVMHPQSSSQVQNSQPPPPQPQPQSRISDRRDLYGSVPEPRSVQHHAPPPSQVPQSQQLSMGYPTAPPSRTYTPPQPTYGAGGGVGGHSHGHHNHPTQQQQQQQQIQQQYQQQYQHAGPAGPSQHHQSSYQNHPNYGPPLQALPQRGLHIGTPMNQQGHYRYNTEDRR